MGAEGWFGGSIVGLLGEADVLEMFNDRLIELGREGRDRVVRSVAVSQWWWQQRRGG